MTMMNAHHGFIVDGWNLEGRELWCGHIAGCDGKRRDGVGKLESYLFDDKAK